MSTNPNRKFLLDEFKRCLSASGFRGNVRETSLGYTVDIEFDSIKFPQLAKLAELLGTRKIEVTAGRYDGGMDVEVQW